ncbi:MAG: helix-turn-helix domain-containing protein [Spirochaetia bacterium]|nr:helix-turn-helix domain-containing protein [Spirochaetia bacterium]
MSTNNNIIFKIRLRIKGLRTEKALTQEKLAALSGVDYKHIQLLESKNPPAARIDTLEKICFGFSIGLDDFFHHEIFEKQGENGEFRDR